MAKVELKRPIVEEIANVIDDAASVVLVKYIGLNVDEDTQFRKGMREGGINYKVYKNTMMNFAFQGTPCEELCKHLEGPNALAVSKDDATAPARMVAEFAKKFPQLEMIAAIVEGNYYDADGVKALAAVPTREVLLGRLFGSMQGPISSFARVLKQIAEQGGEAAPAEEAAEAPAEAPAEEAAEAVAEAPAEEAAEAVAEEAAEAPAEEAAEAVAEEPAEETAEAPAEES